MQHHSCSIRAQSDSQIKRSFLESRNSVQLWEYFHHILKCGYFYKMSLSCQYYGLTTEVLERLAADKTVCDWYCYDLSQNPVFELRKRCINQDETGFLLPLPTTIYTITDLVPSSLHYVIILSWNEANSLHYPPSKIVSL